MANFGNCELGDSRRTDRAVQVAARMADCPGGSSPQQMTDWAELKACYRLFHSPSVTFDALARPHWEQTCAATQGFQGRILVLNDSTAISYSHRSQIEGFTRAGKGMTYGFELHNALMVNAVSGEILGLARQELFHRVHAPEKENRRQRARRPRETDVWGRVIDAIGAPAKGVEYVHVCDRGADNLEVFCHLRQQQCQWIIRCCHLNRDVQPVVQGALSSPKGVEETLADLPVLGTASLSLRSRNGQAAYKAQLEIRATEVSIPQPRRRTPYLRQLNYRELRQTLVEVREVDLRRGATPLKWVLWTSLPVMTLENALEVIGIYEKRWVIEEFHKAMKTGCQIESKQYESAHCLEGIAGMISVLAVRLLAMKYLARSAPTTPAADVVPREWLMVVETLRRKRLPTIRDFVRNLAALGGFLMRKNDGEPGWITIWRGTQILIISLKATAGLHKKCG